MLEFSDTLEFDANTAFELFKPETMIVNWFPAPVLLPPLVLLLVTTTIVGWLGIMYGLSMFHRMPADSVSSNYNV